MYLLNWTRRRVTAFSTSKAEHAAGAIEAVILDVHLKGHGAAELEVVDVRVVVIVVQHYALCGARGPIREGCREGATQIERRKVKEVVEVGVRDKIHTIEQRPLAAPPPPPISSSLD